MATARDDVFLYAARGNGDALYFLRSLFAASDAGDDVEDEPPRPGRACVLMASLMNAMTSPFYRTHELRLLPMMQIGLISWDASNEMNGQERIEYASTLQHVVFYTALICGDATRAKEAIVMWVKSSKEQYELE